MLKIVSGKISMTRGDTAVLNCKIYYSDANGTEYTMQSGDSLVFTVRTSAKTTSATDFTFQKTFTNNQITISPTDTASLAYGNYVYDVQLTLSDGTVNTIIPINVFCLTEEVT